MSEGLGLLITPDHEETINGFNQVSPLFCASSDDVPSEWIPELFVEHQYRTRTCAGHSEALLCSHSNLVQTGECVRFSRKFAYLTAQLEGGYSGSDNGTSIHSTLVAATKYGCCTEATFPLDWDGPEDYRTGWTSEAQREAYQHRHHGETAFDLRDWSKAIAWLTDRRPIIIGTTWYSAQGSIERIEDKKAGSSGRFLGYHARVLIGHTTLGGMCVPVCQNSHGADWADRGRSVITPDLWDYWRRDAAFVSLGFNEVDEIEPKRRSWLTSLPGDEN